MISYLEQSETPIAKTNYSFFKQFEDDYGIIRHQGSPETVFNFPKHKDQYDKLTGFVT